MATNRPDCAMMPGARKSRYRTWPVRMAWIRLNVSPKITSHSTGCTARVSSSVRSWRSFCSSTTQNVTTLLARRRQGCSGARARGSAQTPGGETGAAYGTDPSIVDAVVELRAGVVAEDVLEAGAGAEGSLELGRPAHGSDGTEVHEGDPVAQRLGFFHVVGGEHDGRPPFAARLVEDEQRRSVHERLRQLEASHHPARVRARQPVGGVGETHGLECFGHAGGPLSRRTSCPKTSTRPSCRGRSVLRTRMVVVLPAPLGPSSPNTSCWATSRSTPSSATCSPKRWRSPLQATAGTLGAYPGPAGVGVADRLTATRRGRRRARRRGARGQALPRRSVARRPPAAGARRRRPLWPAGHARHPPCGGCPAPGRAGRCAGRWDRPGEAAGPPR